MSSYSQILQYNMYTEYLLFKLVWPDYIIFSLHVADFLWGESIISLVSFSRFTDSMRTPVFYCSLQVASANSLVVAGIIMIEKTQTTVVHWELCSL